VELDDATRDLVQGGSVLIIGATDAEGAPLVARAWGCEIGADDEVSLWLAGGDPVLAAAVMPGGLLAFTATDVRTLRSRQFKGVVRETAAAPPGELAVVSRYRRDMFTAIHDTDGIPVDLLERLVPDSFIVVTLRVASCFDQTPGPEAGAPVADGSSPGGPP
jgi:hypothetical protein